MRRVTVRCRRDAGAPAPPGAGRRAAPARAVRPAGQAPLHHPARPPRLRRTRPRRAAARRRARLALGRHRGSGRRGQLPGPARQARAPSPRRTTCSSATSPRCPPSPRSARRCPRPRPPGGHRGAATPSDELPVAAPTRRWVRRGGAAPGEPELLAVGARSARPARAGAPARYLLGETRAMVALRALVEHRGVHTRRCSSRATGISAARTGSPAGRPAELGRQRIGSGR